MSSFLRGGIGGFLPSVSVPGQELQEDFADPTQGRHSSRWWKHARSPVSVSSALVSRLAGEAHSSPLLGVLSEGASGSEQHKVLDPVRDTAASGGPDIGYPPAAKREGHTRPSEVQVCKKLCEDGRISDAVGVLTLLVQRGCRVDNYIFYRILRWCTVHKDLALGRHVHELAIQSGYQGDAFLATHLISLYSANGRVQEWTRVFAQVAAPDAHNWAAIISAHSRHGDAAAAIALYRRMRCQSASSSGAAAVQPDNRIYVAVLKACAAAKDLGAGMEVHEHVAAGPGEPDVFVRNGLIDMYAKCGRLETARAVFEQAGGKDVVTWTAMIAGYARHGMGEEALVLSRRMRVEGGRRTPPPNAVTYVCVLQACASVGAKALGEGKQVHSEVRERGLLGVGNVGSSLVTMYAKCGSVDEARRVYDALPGRSRNVGAWTAMIAGYAQQGMGRDALDLYASVRADGLCRPPDSVTYVCLLQACAGVGVGALEEGRQIHGEVRERGMQADDVVLTGALVNMYAKCGSIEDARTVFDTLPARDRDIVSWTTMMAAYVHQGMGHEALSLYSKMQQQQQQLESHCWTPNPVTYVCLLQACACVGVGAVHLGRQLHAEIKQQGLLHQDVGLGGSLVNMYAKCGSLGDARAVFDALPSKNVVAWNAILAGYTQQGLNHEALGLYRSTMLLLQQQQQQQAGGIGSFSTTTPDSVTFVCLLQACANLGAQALGDGKRLHAEIEQGGLLLLHHHHDLALGSSLVNMYGKCGSVEDARRVFDALPARNVVTWTAMITAYAQHGMCAEALALYSRMQQDGLTPPNSVTLVCLLHACAAAAALPLGKRLHAQAEEQGVLQADPAGVGAAVVNMYAKCGSMAESQQVFDSLPQRSLEAWNALMAGYTRQGDSRAVLGLLDRMSAEGACRPDAITLLAVLTVCSHAGLVDQGRRYFAAMSSEYGVSPAAEHFACMVDLLARAGRLDEALGVARTMPFPPTEVVWHSLLGACWKWKNVEIGRQAFRSAVSLNEKDDVPYVLMSNIYAGAEMWADADEMHARRQQVGAWKTPGQTWWTDMSGEVHTFVVGGRQEAF